MNEISLTIPKGKYIRKKLEDIGELKLYDYLVQIYCVMENKTLPFAERSLLTYYAVSGINPETEKKYMDDFNRNKQAVSNLKYGLVKRGFLSKREDMNVHELPLFLKQKRDSLTIIIELDAGK